MTLINEKTIKSLNSFASSNLSCILLRNVEIISLLEYFSYSIFEILISKNLLYQQGLQNLNIIS